MELRVIDWTAQGGGIYRIFGMGWWADVEIFFAGGSREWVTDVLATNSASPEYQIADAAIAAIGVN